MTTEAIRKQLVDYLKTADDKKVKAIYTMVEDEINTQANEWDEDFKAELDNRRKSFGKGPATTYSWDETRKAAAAKVKSRSK